MTAREAASALRNPMLTALLTLLVNAGLYLLTVRDDVRDTKAMLREVRCEVAVGFRKPVLPEGCAVNSAALLAPSAIIQSGSVKP